MEITGIIAEYNPLHQGHIYHIKQTIELLHPDILVVIVSSWFSQRALPSMLLPADKARLAMEYGADLVIELPCVYAAQAADQFAKYSIEALKTAGVTSIVFGSETNDIQWLESCAARLDELEKNPSTSLARNMEEQMGFHGANDILGVQYVRWCHHFDIKPYCIARSDRFISATQSRKDFFAGKVVWNQELMIQEQSWDFYYPYLRLYLQLTSASYLKESFLCSEGLEHRLKRLAGQCLTWSDFLEDAITRTYTRARIQRTCLFILLQISWKEMQEHDSFFLLRLLGASSKGRTYLKTLPPDTRICSRFKELPEFLQKVELKAKALYFSVIDESLPIVHPLLQNKFPNAAGEVQSSISRAQALEKYASQVVMLPNS